MNDNQALPKAMQIIQGLLNTGQLQQIIDYIDNQSDDLKNITQIQKIRALVLIKLQRYAEARDTLLKVLSQNPMQHDIKHNLAFVYRQLNEFEPAIEYARSALELAPEVVKYNLYLSRLHKESKQILKAVQVLRIALLKGVNDDELICEFAALLNTTYEYQEALEVLDNSQESFYSLLLTLEARIQLNHYAEAMSIVPDLIKLLDNADQARLIKFSDMLRQLGEFEKADQILSSLNEMTYELAYKRIQSPSYVKGHTTEHSKDNIEALSDEPALQNLSQEQNMNLNFAYSNHYFSLNNVTEGFAYCHLANAENAPDKRFKADVKSAFSAIANTFTNHDLCNVTGADSDRPVFIIGMPCSGASLLENIISAHSRAFGAGEAPYLNLALNEMDFYAKTHTDRLKYLSKICDWTDDDCQHMTAYYLNHLRAYDQYADKIVDMLPHNFMHLGVIIRLFPKAHIIHVKRNPVANCLAIYQENMDAFHLYGNDLNYLAEYYKQYEKLMSFWQQTLSLDNYLSVNYEDLLTERETSVREVLTFLGLDIEAQCLDFYDAEHTHTSALKPWLGREDHIQPLLAAFPQAK
ncbi:MAG: sulfotransferase [Gammaproteobacteria bacterium]|nr:sulfotransferase [Gammaproteobacteria bacterium]